MKTGLEKFKLMFDSGVVRSNARLQRNGQKERLWMINPQIILEGILEYLRVVDAPALRGFV